MPTGRSFLAFYCGVLTAALPLVVLDDPAKPVQQLDEIDVERINIVEPDGTIRLVLSNRARFPGLIFEGREYDHPNRSTAGMLFFNDEGTEQGGLVLGGETDEDGRVTAYGQLSFDQYEQDQVITLNATEDGGLRKSGISVWDRPEYSMEEVIRLVEETRSLPEAERRAALDRIFAGREPAQPRLYLGKSQNGSVSLRLNDPQGRERLVVEVAADGSPTLRFFDEAGEEVARFPD